MGGWVGRLDWMRDFIRGVVSGEDWFRGVIG